MRARSWLAVGVCAAAAACSSSNGGSGSGANDGGAEAEVADSASPPIDSSTGPTDSSAPSDAKSADAAPKDATADAPAVKDAGPDTSIAGWTLTWHDEFDGPNGTAPDSTKWTYDTGGGGWGNQEREYYTNDLANAQQTGGNLLITATPNGASSQTCWYGTCLYTSARLKTQGLFFQAYGRFEARAKMPFGKGLWPAFWMLGENINTVNWPACGEIDILETIGTDITNNHGSLHAPNYNPTGQTGLPNGAKFSDAFHTFAAEWDPGEVRFYVDDVLYETQDQSGVGSGTWEFDHPFFLLLNVAVGGTWPGDPDSTTTFPQTLEVDWVRVYQRASGDP